MTRAEAISIITAKLEGVDDATLADVALRMTSADDLTAGDILVALPSAGALPRALSARELGLVEQSREDFRLGRTSPPEQSRAWVDAELERRRRRRSTA
jgi:hypothetical protein